jgi:hypothetical protein
MVKVGGGSKQRWVAGDHTVVGGCTQRTGSRRRVVDRTRGIAAARGERKVTR